MDVTELEKLEYEAWVKELYEKGYRYIIGIIPSRTLINKKIVKA